MADDALVLTRPKSSSIRLLLGALAFVGIGVLMARGALDSPDRPSDFMRLIGWVSILFGSVGAFKVVVSLIWPTQLHLSPQGFQVVEGKPRSVVPWSSVDRFFLVEIRGAKIVAYDLRPEMKSALANAWARHRPQWGDGSLPTYLEVDPDRLLSIVEDWRGRHISLGQ